MPLTEFFFRVIYAYLSLLFCLLCADGFVIGLWNFNKHIRSFTNLVEFFKATSNYMIVINRIAIRSLVNVENPYHVA